MIENDTILTKESISTMYKEEVFDRLDKLRSKCKTCYQHAELVDSYEYQILRDRLMEIWRNENEKI